MPGEPLKFSWLQVISMEAARSIEISWSYVSTYGSPVLVQSETAAVQAIFKQ